MNGPYSAMLMMETISVMSDMAELSGKGRGRALLRYRLRTDNQGAGRRKDKVIA